MFNKSFFVVGGSSGIGAEIVSRLAGAGHQVFATSRQLSYSRQEANVKGVSFDAAGGEWTTDDLPDTLQGLVYCPGTINLKSFRRLTDKDFHHDWEVNFLGAVRVVRACIDRLKKSEGGASIVLFSTVAVQIGMPLHASIAAAKGAVEGLTKALAAEFSPEVRVNAIAPSLTNTPLTASLLKTDKHIEAAKLRHPLKDIGDPAEVAQFAVQLLDGSLVWATGQVFTIDGGLSSIRVLS